jgi:hypothetical protein
MPCWKMTHRYQGRECLRPRSPSQTGKSRPFRFLEYFQTTTRRLGKFILLSTSLQTIGCPYSYTGKVQTHRRSAQELQSSMVNTTHLFAPNVLTQNSLREFLFSEPIAICCTPKILNLASLVILEVEKSLLIIL